MNDQSMPPQTGPSERRHPAAVLAVTARILRRSPARARDMKVGAGRRVHVIEAGKGPPVVLLHGTSTSSLLLLPLLERLEGVRAIAVDRPGFGLSDPAGVPRERFRTGAVEFLDQVLDELQLDTAALAGNSMGGTWALWYALARPDRLHRLVLLGAAPLLPGTRVPPPLRLLATPVVGELLQRLTNPNPKLVVRMMGSMGEQDTIINYPDQIKALVAAGNDPVISEVNLAEVRAVISPLGFRRSLRVRPDELRQLSVPTLLLWGDHDPVGAVKVAQVTANLIPNAHLEVLPAGHGPWLGNPDRTAELVSKFVR
jgi:pimeloyl-ACP methyl ester carboxylesterase